MALPLLGAALCLLTLGVLHARGRADPAADVRLSASKLVAAVKHDRTGEFCGATTQPRVCAATVGVANAVGIRLSDLAAGVSEHVNGTVMVNGDHARLISGGATSDWVRRGGRWLFVYTDK